jgi:hypothetical protein
MMILRKKSIFLIPALFILGLLTGCEDLTDFLLGPDDDLYTLVTLNRNILTIAVGEGGDFFQEPIPSQLATKYVVRLKVQHVFRKEYRYERVTVACGIFYARELGGEERLSRDKGRTLYSDREELLVFDEYDFRERGYWTDSEFSRYCSDLYRDNGIGYDVFEPHFEVVEASPAEPRELIRAIRNYLDENLEDSIVPSLRLYLQALEVS